MAKVFPQKLPEYILGDPKRRAEVKVYTALKTLGAKYSVFYSVSWIDKTYEDEAKDGEADFVIVHPDYGVLFLEVKGGGIEYEAETDYWFTNNRHANHYSLPHST